MTERIKRNLQRLGKNGSALAIAGSFACLCFAFLLVLASADPPNSAGSSPSESEEYMQVDWGEPACTSGDYFEGPTTWPDWAISAWKRDGEFITMPPYVWCVSASAPENTGSLNMDIDRSLFGYEGAILELTFRDTVQASVYLSLYSTNDVVVAADLYGNLLDGSGEDKRVVYEIPFMRYPEAVGVRIHRGIGAVSIYGSLLRRSGSMSPGCGMSFSTDNEDEERPKIILDSVIDQPDMFSPILTSLTFCAQYRVLPTDSLVAQGKGGEEDENKKLFFVKQVIEVIDDAGQVVRSFEEDFWIDPAGIENASQYVPVDTETVWDGKDAGGLCVADATYSYRVVGTYLRIKPGKNDKGLSSVASAKGEEKVKVIAITDSFFGTFVLDGTPPVTTAEITPPANEHGWHKEEDISMVGNPAAATL